MTTWRTTSKLVIGMLHAPPLPGSPWSDGSLQAARDVVLHDADQLVSGGVRGLILENFGDTPYYPGSVPATVIACMTVLAAEVRQRFDVLLGINILRNDASGSLAVAHAVAADFIRVNVLCGARVTDQGLVEGKAHDLLRERALLGAQSLRILADIDVKHSAPLAVRPLEDEVAETIARGGADAVIISGRATGVPPDVSDVRIAKDVAPNHPVFIGSGVSHQTVQSYLEYADGFIVGTAFKKDGALANPVDVTRVRDFMSLID